MDSHHFRRFPVAKLPKDPSSFVNCHPPLAAIPLRDWPEAILLQSCVVGNPQCPIFLHAQGNDLKTEGAAGTEKSAGTGETAQDKLSHEFGFISYGYGAAPALTA